MRFSTCYSLITKRGFFIYQNFFLYEVSVVDYFHKRLGSGKFGHRCFQLWYETHATRYDMWLTFQGYGIRRSVSFGFFLLSWFVPHGAFYSHRAWYILRLFKILSYRGRRHAQGLPTRGQRTHSNNARNVWRNQIQTLIRSLQIGILQQQSVTSNLRAALTARGDTRLRKQQAAVKHKSKKTSKAAPSKAKKSVSKKKPKVDVWR